MQTSGFEATEFQRAARELADYYARKLRILEEVFGFRLPELAAREDLDGSEEPLPFDRQQVVSLARACLERVAALGDPFWKYYEGRPAPLESALRERSRLNILQLNASLEDAYQDLFIAALVALDPALQDRKLPHELLQAKGLPENPPDPDDFF